MKEAKIREAEGEATAILKIQQANADGIRFLKDAVQMLVLQIKVLRLLKKLPTAKRQRLLFRRIFRGLQDLQNLS